MMLTPGKLYKAIKPYKFTGPAIRNPNNKKLWRIHRKKDSDQQIPAGSIILCVEQFTTTYDYCFPYKNMGVFLYNDGHHIMYENEVEEV